VRLTLDFRPAIPHTPGVLAPPSSASLAGVVAAALTRLGRPKESGGMGPAEKGYA